MEQPETPNPERLVDKLSKWPPLAKVADAWQPLVHTAIERAGREVADALHGTPLGHPLHPLLTDVPIGAWSVTAVLDALELAGRTDLAGGADASLTIGIAGAALAAAAGWADWSDTADEAKNLGMAHAVLNGSALGAYVASLALRRSGRRGPGIGLAMLGLALVGAAGYLGGELSYGLQVGVKQTAEPLSPPAKFVAALDADALADGTMQRVEVEGMPILLYREGKAVHAISAVCTHAGGPLNEGKIADGCVECPWHGSVFRLRDGAAVHGPATFPAARYDVRIVKGKIQVRAAA